MGIGKARNLQGTYSFIKSLSALETGHAGLAGAGLPERNREKGSIPFSPLSSLESRTDNLTYF